MEFVEIGKVVKLHGYLGQMKVNAKFDKDFNLKDLKKVYDLDKNEYDVERVFSSKDAIVVGLKGVDLEKSKTFIGKPLFMNRELTKGRILIEDLKKSHVFFENGNEIGVITDVQDYGAAEVFFVKTTNGKEVLFPNADGIIVSFDYKDKKLVINEKIFREVCDYEN